MKIVFIDADFQLSDLIEEEIAATIGFFDGVHRGHRFLIEQLLDVARSSGLPSTVITFSVHPRKVLQSDFQPELLNSFDEKLFQLGTTGIDYCFVIEFTKELSHLSAEEFICEKLRKVLRVKDLLIGYDHRFGRDREGDFEDYCHFGEKCGMSVIRAKQLKEDKLHLSSTFVRKLLAVGDVRNAAEILSYSYSLEGIIIPGNKMGRELGFPTANIVISEEGKVTPQEGIYATRVEVDQKIYRAMTYIGTRPTVQSGGELRIETHLLDFDGDLYGKLLHIEFIEHIREDRKFDTLEELREQLKQDRIETEAIFANQE